MRVLPALSAVEGSERSTVCVPRMILRGRVEGPLLPASSTPIPFLFIHFRTLLRNGKSLSALPSIASALFAKNTRGGGTAGSYKNPFKWRLRSLPWFPASCEAPCGDSSSCSPLSTVDCQLSARASSLECALPQFCTLTPLECAVTKTGSSKLFRMRSYEKKWGRGLREHSRNPRPHC